MLYASLVRGLASLAAMAVVGCDGASAEPEQQTRESLRAEARAALDGGMQSVPLTPAMSDAAAATCSLPPDCEGAKTAVFSLEPCCTERVACGFASIDAPPELTELQETVATAVGLTDGETCAPRDRYFIRHPGSEDLRVKTESGDEILLTTGCDTASILSINFVGCCMPNNRCGVSTYGMWDTLAVLAPGEPFGRLQCVSSKELNAQIGSSKLRGLRFLPDTDKACDYAALDAWLPPAEPYVW